MIYMKGIYGKEIDFRVNAAEKEVICYIILSDGRRWKYQPKNIDPIVFSHRQSMELFSIQTISEAIKKLGEELGYGNKAETDP
jgi:hypothetical protein